MKVSLTAAEVVAPAVALVVEAALFKRSTNSAAARRADDEDEEVFWEAGIAGAKPVPEWTAINKDTRARFFMLISNGNEGNSK